MPGYRYQGTGRDELTQFMDRPAKRGPIASKKWNSWQCRRCHRAYSSRWHSEVCVPERDAEKAARGPRKHRRPRDWICIECGHDYRSKLHKNGCKDGTDKA